jgi:hypothetical protein
VPNRKLKPSLSTADRGELAPDGPLWARTQRLTAASGPEW